MHLHDRAGHEEYGGTHAGTVCIRRYCRGCFPVGLSGHSGRGRLRFRGDDITLESLHPRTFDKDSPVTAYWLTRCDGFRVAGLRGEAVVDGTIYDDDPSKPLALRIRRGPADTSLIPLQAVDGMCPTRRIVYVRRRPSISSRAGRTTARAAASSWRYTAPRVRAGARESAAAARRQWPAVQRGAYAVGRGTVLVVLMLGTVLVWTLANAVRLAGAGYVVARRAAPHGARLAGGSVALARRALR